MKIKKFPFGTEKYTLTFGEVWPIAVVVVGASVALAWMAYRLYDLPLRRWLTEKWLTKSGAKEK